MPIEMVATVDEYFFKIVSAYLKKEDKIPYTTLLNIKSMVSLECPYRMSKLLGPLTLTIPTIPRKLNKTPCPYKNIF